MSRDFVEYEKIECDECGETEIDEDGCFGPRWIEFTCDKGNSYDFCCERCRDDWLKENTEAERLGDGFKKLRDWVEQGFQIGQSLQVVVDGQKVETTAVDHPRDYGAIQGVVIATKAGVFPLSETNFQ